jgi:hypothetical protein
MSFPFCPFGQIVRAVHHDGMETLLAAVETFTAKRVVCYSVPLVQEKLPFQLALFAHSRHENLSFHRRGRIDDFLQLPSIIFVENLPGKSRP